VKEILVSSDHLEDRVATLENGRLAEIFIARGERMVGSIYKGRVANVLPGMQAAFVDIGLERNTFLCLDDALPSYLHEDVEVDSNSNRRQPWVTSIEQVVKPRQETLVQLVKEPIGAKGARITTNISLPGRYLVLMPLGNYVGISRRVESAEERERLKSVGKRIKPDDMGLIIRTAAERKDEAVLKHDLDSLVRTWESIQKKAEKVHAPSVVHQELGLIDRALRDMFTDEVSKFMVDSRPIFEKVVEFAQASHPHLASRIFYYEGKRPLFELYGVETEIEKLLRKRVWLPSGGYIIIEPTEALTVIDVNTGKFVGSHSFDETILKTNLEAAYEIARQMRLRDISGIIVADFIDMERKEDRRKLLAALEEHLKEDRVRATIFGITSLGLVEITRKRAGKNIDRIMREECFYCGGHGRVLNPESVAIRLEREIRRASADSEEEAVLVVAQPQVALNLSGSEGQRLAALEKITGKEIFLRADPNNHMEHYRLDWGKRDSIAGRLEFLNPDSVLDLEIQGVHPANVQNGIIFRAGQILEIVNGGNLVGERATIRVKSAGRSYAVSEVIS